MPQPFFGRPQFLQTIIVSVVTFAALALLGIVLAYWTWTWWGPRPAARADIVATPAVRITAAYNLFGAAPPDRAAAPTGMAIRLAGVIAATGSARGHAIVQLEPNKTLVVVEGEEISPGIRLAKINADNVVLERNGVSETLTWPQQAAPESPARAQK